MTVFDPRIVIHAGPWESTVGKMISNGWEIIRSRNEWDMSYTICLRHKHLNRMSNFMVIRDFEAIHTPNYLYFNDSIVLTAQICESVMSHAKINEFDSNVLCGEVYYGSHQKEMLVEYTPSSILQIPEPEDIIVIPEKIPELLEKIREAQIPRAREILADNRRKLQKENCITSARILNITN